jgi:ferritin
MENNSPQRSLKTIDAKVVKPTLSRPSEKEAPKPAPANKSKNPLITDDCVKMLNYRIEQEDYSSRVYLAMSLWLDDKGYVNASKLWKKYSDEERAHADMAREYLLDLGIRPITPLLNQPVQEFSGLPQIIKDSHEHEAEITRQCKELASHAMKMGDHMLYQLAATYLKEQIEELGKAQNWLDQLESFGEDKIAMRLLDHEMKDYL